MVLCVCDVSDASSVSYMHAVSYASNKKNTLEHGR